MNVLGAGGCAVLAVTLPPVSIAAATGVIAVGLGGRWLVARRLRRHA
jgi:APA family basic amino acid/polyamine antiporter